MFEVNNPRLDFSFVLRNIDTINDIISKYHSERKFIFDILTKLYEIDYNGIMQSLTEQVKVNHIMDCYNNSDTLHVEKRKFMFNSIKLYLP